MYVHICTESVCISGGLCEEYVHIDVFFYCFEIRYIAHAKLKLMILPPYLMLVSPSGTFGERPLELGDFS